MSTALFFLGGMLGRIAGPVAQDWFTYKTKLGRDIASRKEISEERKRQLEYNYKERLSDREHDHKLQQLQLQFVDSLKKAEHQMILAQQEWKQKLFWEKCFPLRNPYELPIGYEPKFEDSVEILERCKLNSVSVANNRQIVPLRVITALKDNTHSTSLTINGELSMFLVNNFSVAGEHAVLSDIGSWREDAPINDASINYLFKGLKGQPTMVIVPVYTNGGSTIHLKVWSWGLGEELNGSPLPYPIGFDFGWFNLDAIKRNTLYSEVKAFRSILDKTGLTLPPELKKLNTDLKRLPLFEKYESQITEEEFDNLLSLMDIPEEIKSNVERKTNEIASTIVSCLAGMYADGYHLSQYGTLPQMPYLIKDMKGIELMFPILCDYYRSLANSKLIEGIITPEQAIAIEMPLAKEMKRLGGKPDSYTEMISDIRLLNHTVNGEEHNRIISELRNLNDKNDLKQIEK